MSGVAANTAAAPSTTTSAPAVASAAAAPTAAASLALAWLVLAAQQLAFATSALAGSALESALAALVGCAVWAAASLAASACGAPRGRATVVACGAVSSVAGVLLVLPLGGAWPLVMLFAHVATACEVVYRALSVSAGRRGPDAAAGCGLLVAAAVHTLARVVAGSFGSFGNAGFYAQVSVVAVSLLPVCAAAAWALSPTRREARGFGVSPGDGARPAALPGVAALVALYGLLTCVAMVFNGVVASPYQVDMLACGDRASLAIAAVGALVWALSRSRRASGLACAAALALLSLAGMVGGMVSYAVAADPASPLPLAAVQAAGACLFAAAWALVALVGLPGRRPAACAVLLVALAVPARFVGIAVKHAVGLDGRTTVAFVLAATVILAVLLLASVVAVALSSHRALREAADERARAIEGAVEGAVESAMEGARHDPEYALGAIYQVYSDVLSDFGLSDREIEIAVLTLTEGKAEKVGEVAGISTNTVRWHLRNIYSKVGVSGKLELYEKMNELLSQHAR